ncbi:MAG: GNAT family N-acetyltransferase [Candidatus Bathyarchaeota archaeon]|nr:GNAT family N-acetyltransferase [Candidatus Bathyarchaeota archaeon]
MSNLASLEQFWCDLVLNFRGSKKLDDAIAISYPKAPFFAVNHVADVKAKEESSANLLVEAEGFFRSQKVPFSSFRISPQTPSTFRNCLEENGFLAQSDQSVMIYSKTALPQFSNSQGTTVKAVENMEDVEVMSDLMMEIFEMPPEWKQGFLEFNVESFQRGWRFYLAYVDDEPVGTCALFSSGGVSGIFNVGTLKQYRGYGTGSALTIQALKDSMAEGNVLHSLQAECGGNAERLYLKLGFVVDHKIQFYAKDLT